MEVMNEVASLPNFYYPFFKLSVFTLFKLKLEELYLLVFFVIFLISVYLIALENSRELSFLLFWREKGKP